MTLHPWPSTDTDLPSARQPILWKRGSAHGLLIDSPAIPLRFAHEIPLDTPVVTASMVQTLQAGFDSAQQRIRELEALLAAPGPTLA